MGTVRDHSHMISTVDREIGVPHKQIDSFDNLVKCGKDEEVILQTSNMNCQ